MSDLTFSQPERRNLLLPIALTLLIIGGLLYALLRFTPHRTADLTVTHTAVYGAHTVFKAESTVVGRDSAQDDLYVIVGVHLQDDLRLPLFLNDITASLTPGPDDPAGNQPITTSAVEHSDLANLYVSFPAVKKLADAAGAPLLRESRIEPGGAAQGFIILHFPVTQATWDHRVEATLTITLYHQAPQTVTIPKSLTGQVDSQHQ